MQYVLDGLALVFVIFFFLSGWHKGVVISFLGGIRLLVATIAAYFISRYLGGWLAPLITRPRIILVPTLAIFSFASVLFLFKYIVFKIRQKRETQTEEDFERPIWRCFAGALINLSFGVFVLVQFFWLAELFVVVVGGRALPGAEKSYFSTFSRRVVYEISYTILPKNGNESQVAAMARMISHPALGIKKLTDILDAKTFQALLNDKDFRKDFLSGDPERIEKSPVMQTFFEDQEIQKALRDFGIISSKGKKGICLQLSKIGKDKAISSSLESLQAKDLLKKDKINELIRDPDFDILMGELLK
jgi:hypothetical protein